MGDLHAPPVHSADHVRSVRTSIDWRRLSRWLLRDREITQQEYERIVERCTVMESRQHPLVRLAQLGVQKASDGTPMDMEYLVRFLAHKAGLEYLKIDPLKVDAGRIAETMSSSYSERHKILPVQVSPTEIVVATSQPFLTDWVPEVERQCRKDVRLVVSNPEDIARYTTEFYSISHSIKAVTRNGTGQGSVSFEQLVELGKNSKNLDANDQGIVQLVDWLWQYAFEQGASDIHLEPRRDMAVARFRIDGVLHPVYQLPQSVMAAVTARIKLLGRMDVVERRRPQDGRIKTRNALGNEVEMRLSSMPTAFGEKLVMRIFDPDSTVKTLEQLGFAEHDAERWQELISKPSGIILVTGPTGSGKTTTLYSTLKRLATEEVNVATIEDPIEMIEPAFNQTQAQSQLDFGFAEGVRTLMRQDPDIIMVGEIRDLETADMAIQAALTGHLVFSTLHTNDAPSAITRLIELGVPSYLINATLLGVLAQRLVRILCPHCKQPDTEGEQQSLLRQAVKPWKIHGAYQGYTPVGCLECRNTGYRGRMGVYELLTISETFKKLVTPQPDIDTLRRQGVKDGMRPLRLAGSLRVAEGLTTLDELLAATPALDWDQRASNE
ncbi:GspE/PulE family protein [Brachymonas sp.]|uniref:GspE/PulE family protein n=1 Tax=unclassified Brachymonas TaxID=2621329 RepID=UPI0035B4F58A